VLQALRLERRGRGEDAGIPPLPLPAPRSSIAWNVRACPCCVRWCRRPRAVSQVRRSVWVATQTDQITGRPSSPVGASCYAMSTLDAQQRT
jgi:hypothetical protein